jgi:hypothetical protein
MEASAPLASHIEPEPHGWQPRALWVTARLLCGAASFFFLAFVFAYFYLRSLDKPHGRSAVHPSAGLGIAVVVPRVLGASAARGNGVRSKWFLPSCWHPAAVLQCVEYTTLVWPDERRLRKCSTRTAFYAVASAARTGSRLRSRARAAREGGHE